MATQDKVAFITGANKGIGLETARGLGKLGIAVVIGSRDEAKGRAAADKLRAEGIEKSRPSGSTSPGPRIIRRSPGFWRSVTASSTSWSTTRASCSMRPISATRAGSTRRPR